LQYNGKEKTEDFSLMYNDHGARNLCLQTGRWTGVDELAQQYYSSSTFCFVDNNPITRVDLNGKDWDIVFEEGKDGSKKYTLTCKVSQGCK
jgi:RHS repeat-associated protein